MTPVAVLTAVMGTICMPVGVGVAMMVVMAVVTMGWPACSAGLPGVSRPVGTACVALGWPVGRFACAL
jgi:hypothetical protein